MNISFSASTPRFQSGEKDITRRMTWTPAVGSIHMAVKQVQGLKKGEKQQPIGRFRVLDVRRERLDVIDREDCKREGFGHLTPAEFVAMFCKLNRHRSCRPDTIISRIVFVKIVDVYHVKLGPVAR